MTESFLSGKVTLLRGDCLELLPTLAENSIDSCVTDPPYHLTSIVKRFGSENAAPCQVGKTGAYARASKGFMGKQWDGGDIAFNPLVWELVFRVLKPGAHLLAFGGTRTYHRLACAVEDAGFDVRDCIMWHFGSGFPKSHDISKAIDRQNGVEREIVGYRDPKGSVCGDAPPDQSGSHKYTGELRSAAAVHQDAIQWQGWGTALKPATEIIVLARKPLSESSIAANALKHGTGAINIDGCRVGPAIPKEPGGLHRGSGSTVGSFTGEHKIDLTPSARWPANLIHDGSEEVVGRFPESKSSESGYDWSDSKNDNPTRIAHNIKSGVHFGDSGSAARFFYTAKADSDDRLGSRHPTVKPLDLIQYLVRLVTPRNGVVLDPFAGTGTTAEAAFREGAQSILIEREPEYQADIVKRMGLCLSGPDERRAATVQQEPVESTPLFGGVV